MWSRSCRRAQGGSGSEPVHRHGGGPCRRIQAVSTSCDLECRRPRLVGGRPLISTVWAHSLRKLSHSISPVYRGELRHQ